MKNLEGVMAINSEVLHCYAQLATKVAQMVEFAQSERWGELPGAEAECAAIVGRLQVIEPNAKLSPSQSEDACRLIGRIQADQALVNGIVKPQLDQLVETMSALQHRKSLGKAYGQGH
jgi:flagellar protein FliT